MQTKSPSFIDLDHIYHADNCAPLRSAVRSGEVVLNALARENYPGTLLPAGTIPEVRTVGFWDAPCDQQWGLDWHRNEGIEITYVSQGRVAFSAGRTEYDLVPGSLTITRPWQQHRVGDPFVQACKLHWLILDVGVRRPNQIWMWPSWFILSPRDVSQLTTLLQQNEQPVWRANQQIASSFDKLAKVTCLAPISTRESRIKLLINELFIGVLELLEQEHILLDKDLTSSRRGVEIFLEDLPHHVGQNWTLKSMAEACGLGRSQFTRYCQEITNAAPIEYLNRCRVNAAKKLLDEQPNLRITDVADACGFDSSQYFSTVFRKLLGCSPRDYRQALASSGG